MPQGDRVALHDFANGRADRFGKVVAGGQSIGAGQKVLAAVVAWQRVVRMHHFPGHPAGLATEQIISLDPGDLGSIGSGMPVPESEAGDTTRVSAESRWKLASTVRSMRSSP